LRSYEGDGRAKTNGGIKKLAAFVGIDGRGGVVLFARDAGDGA